MVQTVQTNWRMPKDLHSWIARYAAKKHITVSEALNELLRDKWEKRNAK